MFATQLYIEIVTFVFSDAVFCLGLELANHPAEPSDTSVVNYLQ